MSRLGDSVILLSALGLGAFGLAAVLTAPAGSAPPSTTAAVETVPVVEYVEPPVPGSGLEIKQLTDAGIKDSVARVLVASGRAGLVTEAQLAEELPASVLTVLMDREATLSLVEGEQR